jgi:hypothetical protein
VEVDSNLTAPTIFWRFSILDFFFNLFSVHAKIASAQSNQSGEIQAASMKNSGVVRHFFLAFVLALVLYWGSFSFIQHFRERKGPWEVTFQTDAQGVPSIRVDQDWLNITNVQFVFVEERLGNAGLSERVRFDDPRRQIPFGEIVYVDTTFLPGSVMFQLFGHEIELLPRVLALNRKEVPWVSGRVFRMDSGLTVEKSVP